MIGGATRGAGGRALARHLAGDRGDNERVAIGATRGLISDSVADQVIELTAIAAHARAARPLYHVHADPAADLPLSSSQWAEYWKMFEAEFGLGRQAFCEAIHVKAGREHRHRVYSLVKYDGCLLRLDHDHARREKINRKAEFLFGHPLIKGAHNRAVAAALRREGRVDIADALAGAGLTAGPRPVAPTTPGERAIEERTGLVKADAAAAAWAAWQESASADEFEQKLAGAGLTVAAGDKVPVVVDRAGTVWPLARLIGQASKAAGQRVTAAEVSKRLRGLHLPPVAEAAARSRPAPMAQPLVPPPALDRVATGPPLRASEAKIARQSEAKETKMDDAQNQIGQADPTNQLENRPHIQLVSDRTSIRPAAEPNRRLSPYEKQKIAEEQKKKHKAALLNKHYSTTLFKDDPLVKFIREDSAEGVLRVSLRTGQNIIDDGQNVSLTGPIDEEAVKRCMQICEAKNWQKIVVSGPQEFRDLMWAEGQRRGVSITNHSPSAETIKAYALELEARRRQESDAAPPPTTEADRARGRAADLEIEQQKAPAVRQPPTILDRHTQPVRLAAIEGRHIDPARLRRQIETAKIRVTEAARLARIAISHAEYAAKKFKDVSNERDFEVRKEIKVTLDMKASKARNDVRDLKSKSRALLPWRWAAARQAQRDLPEARARAKAATAASDKYRAAGPLQPEFGPMYDKIWKDRERDTRSYRTARENADAARDRQRDAEASLALEAEKLRELEAEAAARCIDLEAPGWDLDDDYEGPAIGSR